MNNSQESEDHSKSNDYQTIEQTMEKLSGGTRRLAAQLTTFASGAGLGTDFCSTGFTGDFFGSISCGKFDALLVKNF